MFRRDVKPLGDVLQKYIRDIGLETPLLQKRAVDAWDTVVGSVGRNYTTEKFIKNQVLFVKITNPALRQDLSMMRTELTRRINDLVGAQIISDVRVY